MIDGEVKFCPGLGNLPYPENQDARAALDEVFEILGWPTNTDPITQSADIKLIPPGKKKFFPPRQ